MNFFQLIDQLAEVDPDVLDRFDSRRAVFNSLGTLARRSALAATPLFMGALFQKAYAGTASVSTDVLNYALTLELLEADFYRQFIASTLIPGGAPAAAIAKIKQHEDAHVTLLTSTIRTLGVTPVAGTSTTGVRFKALPAGATYANYLAVAQVLEDTGVRAYKGRAAELIGAPNDLLTIALQIHSVEARHAAQIRTMRGQLPWINNNDDLKTDPAYLNGVRNATGTSLTLGGATFAIPAYDATKPSPLESNVLQGATAAAAAVNTATALGTPYTADDAAAAFDEYLQAAEVVDASRAGGLLA
ncbi:ferritin-like domain-containing protein [Hymenobacter terricola]|uniref:ferritin-like domain-containing protein n=1 Tax=Hymenobacter terricola TaxID=2819236 RepID=UPI001B302C3C|nr:ferritin-like domain-containing protein [Hymenobacter terricola]